MSNDPLGLPPGWASATLREIAEIVGGLTKDAKKSLGLGFREVPYLRVANVQRGRLDLTEVKLISASEADIQKLSLQTGDMLLNEGGDRDKLGRGWIWQGQLPECIHQNHVFRARLCSRDIDPIYIAHFTNSMAQAYFTEHGSQTTNLASISLTKLGSLPISLPPSQEQQRIVAKLEELLSDLDAGVAELQAAQKKLAQYRQSLLKAAVEGALTQDWRAQHPPQETGAELLERTLKERRARWEARQLAKFESQGKPPPTGWQSKYLEPVAAADGPLPSLPNGWVWSSLDQLAWLVRNGLSQRPSEDATGVPILRISAVRALSVNLADLRYLAGDEETFDDYLLAVGDLLATRYNGSVDLLGVIGVVRGLSRPTLHPDKLIRIRLALDGVLGDWVEICAATGASRAHIAGRARTTAGQTGISGDDIKKMPIPLPPLAEQAEIVSLVTSLLNEGRRLECALAASMKQSAAQRQNILRAAFSGQLVPQDPRDEPAAALLARIRAERAAPGAKPRKPRAAKEST